MANLDWVALGLLGNTNWGFVMGLAPVAAAAAPPPVPLGGAVRGLPPLRQALTAPASLEPSTSTSTLALDALRPSSNLRGALREPLPRRVSLAERALAS